MLTDVERAAREYLAKRGSSIRLQPDRYGYYRPPENDSCPLCEGAQWVTATGAHLKSLEHISEKWQVPIREIKHAAAAMESRMDLGSIAYKKLSISTDVESIAYELLVSPRDDSFVWMPHEVTKAGCEFDHEVPDQTCGCGLYAYWNMENAQSYPGRIVVRLIIGGKIIEATKGVRCEAATIAGIWSDPGSPKLCRQMAEIYGVPLFEDQFDQIPLIEQADPEVLPESEEWHGYDN